MRREKFISGGLEGAGVEGKNKKKLSSKAQHEDEEKDLMDTAFGGTGRPQAKKSSGSKIKSEDPFYTGFGETRQEKRGHYTERSAREKEADIFSDGFGSKEISRGRSAGEGRKSGSFDEETHGEVKDFSDDIGVKSSESQKKRKSPEDDPFYTGFGYTNQRDDGNVRHSENRPLKREELVAGSGDSVRSEDNKGIDFADKDEGIFENVRSKEEVTGEKERDYISEINEKSGREESAVESSVFERDENKNPEEKKSVKKSSIFDRDDDDLFSV